MPRLHPRTRGHGGTTQSQAGCNVELSDTLVCSPPCCPALPCPFWGTRLLRAPPLLLHVWRRPSASTRGPLWSEETGGRGRRQNTEIASRKTSLSVPFSLCQTETTNTHDNVFNLGIFNKSSVATKTQVNSVHCELWTRQENFRSPTCVCQPSSHAMPGPVGHDQVMTT